MFVKEPDRDLKRQTSVKEKRRLTVQCKTVCDKFESESVKSVLKRVICLDKRRHFTMSIVCTVEQKLNFHFKDAANTGTFLLFKQNNNNNNNQNAIINNSNNQNKNINNNIGNINSCSTTTTIDKSQCKCNKNSNKNSA